MVKLRAGRGEEVLPEEVICPVCLSILLEPVLLPCQHVVCLPCINAGLEHALLACPVCRTRISNWARRAANKGNMVEEELWAMIQSKFSHQVAARKEGRDDTDSQRLIPVVYPQLAGVGELGDEWKTEVDRRKRKRVQEEEEGDRLSLELAKHLLEEERRAEEERLRSEVIEKQESRRQRLSSSSSLGKENIRSCFEPPPPRKRKAVPGSWQEEERGRRCPSTESNNSIDSELTHFRPIQAAPLSPPKMLKDGTKVQPSLIRSRPRGKKTTQRKSCLSTLASSDPPAASLSSSVSPTPSPPPTVTSPLLTPSLECEERLSSSSRSSRDDPTPSGQEEQVDTQALGSMIEEGGVKMINDRVVKEQRWLEARIRQEREDAEMARRLNREERRKATPDRRKGKADGYMLRGKDREGSLLNCQPASTSCEL